MSSPIDLLCLETQRLAIFEWRKAGWSTATIAAQLNITRQAVEKIIREELHTLRTQSALSIEDNRQLDLERIDCALKAIWPRLEKGDPRTIDIFIKLQERRSKLLGLDAPERTISVDLTSQLENLSPHELLEEAKRLGLPTPTPPPSHLLPLPGVEPAPPAANAASGIGSTNANTLLIEHEPLPLHPPE